MGKLPPRDVVQEEGPDGTAVYNRTGTHRYLLTRTLAPLSKAGTEAVFVMLNPSTATAFVNDPTIRRCMNFAALWGHARLIVVNIFAFRATDPTALADCHDPIGSFNDVFILDAVESASQVVCAWGAWGSLFGRGQHVYDLVKSKNPMCLGVTAENEPRHPLYIAARTPPTPYLRA